MAYFCRKTDPEVVVVQMDIGWARVAQDILIQLEIDCVLSTLTL
jgi:hypothetical protein